jgi:hypothetical protein
VAEREILALRQEMTIARAEFLRLLPAAVDRANLRVDGDEIRPCDGNADWRIVLSSLDDLRLGAIRLPRQRVELYFAGNDAEGQRRFLARFELYYRRAGG